MSKKLLKHFLNIYTKVGIALCMSLISLTAKAQDSTGMSGVDEMLATGQSMIRVGAKWGGILTVVGSAIALGSGRLEGALAQTICKILIVIGLLAAAIAFVTSKVSYGFYF